MGGRSAELRRTLAVLFMAVAALFAFVPFLLNLLLSFFLGGRLRKRIRSLMGEKADVPVDEVARTGAPGRVYFLAGEDSGDLHAANLVSALRKRSPGTEVRGMGGPRMEQAGCSLDFDLVRMNVMGVIPVLKAVGTFFGLFRRLLRMLEEEPPDVLVPVDYPGFNLRAARAARRRGVRVVYYIAPQVWAWAPWRLRRIARSVDRMLVILPFEAELFRQGGVPCAFVGHPLYEHLQRDVPARVGADSGRSVRRIGILPGSRRAEVRGVLPQMLEAARGLAETPGGVEFVLPYRRADLAEEIRALVDRHGGGLEIRCVEGRTHEVMRDLDLAMVASGTASLELAYFAVPMAVFYRIGRLSAVLKRFALITPHVALVNIVAGRRVVPEYVGAGNYAGAAAGVLRSWLTDEAAFGEVKAGLEEVRSRLLFGGVADRAAGWVLEAPEAP